jgi:uncharacterized protein with NRDE domain
VCTVTYLPKGNTEFILTHNRDEHHLRGVALLPERRDIGSIETIMPIDAKAGGTWIATSKEFTLCLLNGGFEKHTHQPPYKHSRGNIIPDFFLFKDVKDFSTNYNLENIEPFTLIIIEHIHAEVTELVFDGYKLHHFKKDNQQAHIWSSSTLYSSDDRIRRQDYFARFININDFSQEAIIAFHENKFEEYEHEGIQINRNNILQTVSLTSIQKSDAINLLYKDFINHKTVSLAF